MCNCSADVQACAQVLGRQAKGGSQSPGSSLSPKIYTIKQSCDTKLADTGWPLVFNCSVDLL